MSVADNSSFLNVLLLEESVKQHSLYLNAEATGDLRLICEDGYLEYSSLLLSLTNYELYQILRDNCSVCSLQQQTKVILCDITISELKESIESCFKPKDNAARSYQNNFSMAPDESDYALALSCTDNRDIELQEREVSNNNRETIFCEMCGLSFKSMKQLKRHSYREHSTDSRRLFQCEECDKEFLTNYELTAHKVKHSPPAFQCNKCEKRFKSKRNLNEHFQHFHCESEKYICEICTKAFVGLRNFKRHVQIHDKSSKIYQCDKCKRNFKRKDNLKRHLILCS